MGEGLLSPDYLQLRQVLVQALRPYPEAARAVERLEFKGETWYRFPAIAEERFVVGVDLGQSNDPTAVSVIHWTRTPLSSWTPRHAVGNTRNTLWQDYEERFDVRYLERLPLGSPYPAQVQHVINLLSRPPLAGGADLVIDATGVGAPIADLFETAGLEPTRVIISAGFEATDHGRRRWTVPKTELISGMDALLHTGQLKFASSLTDAGALRDELKDFRRKVSEAGRATYAARVGRHDDLILSVAVALWWLRRPTRGSFSVGAVEGLH
jgi:hypothetical protein